MLPRPESLTVTLHWFLSKCWPLIGWEVSDQYLPNRVSDCFHSGTVNSPRWFPDLICWPSRFTDFSLNAGLWLVEWFPINIYQTVYRIASILELWTRVDGSQTWFAHCHASLISRWMLASDWLRGFQSISPKRCIKLLLYWNCELTYMVPRPD